MTEPPGGAGLHARFAFRPPMQEDRVAMVRPRGPLRLVAAISLLWLAATGTTASAAHRRTTHRACGQGTRGHGCPNRLLGAGGAGAAAPATSDGSCANTGLAPTPADVDLVRQALLCLINRQRALGGVAPLRSSAHLASAAQRHSDDMAATHDFGHRGSAGETMGDRLGASGYLRGGRRFTAGENIAWEPAPRNTAAALVAGWMASAEHRVNILDPAFRDTGIGLAFTAPSRSGGGRRETSVTEDFGALV